MTTRSGIGLLAGTALGLAACHPAAMAGRALRVATRLDCPAEQGALARASVASDGRTCLYRGEQGEAVTLELLSTGGRPAQAALAPLEAELERDVPTRGPAHGLGSPAPPGAGVAGGEGHARVDLPGLHVDAHGDKARVRVAGVSIDADGERANVDVRHGFGSIASLRSDEHGVEMHSGSITGANVNLILVLASMAPGPSGDHAGGYVARGPATGPLVVGVLKAPAQGHGGGDPFRDVKRLVNRNVRG